MPGAAKEIAESVEQVLTRFDAEIDVAVQITDLRRVASQRTEDGDDGVCNVSGLA